MQQDKVSSGYLKQDEEGVALPKPGADECQWKQRRLAYSRAKLNTLLMTSPDGKALLGPSAPKRN